MAIAFIAFIIIALIGWGIGELHYKNFTYTEDVPHHPDPTAHQGGEYVEMGLKDILRDNSTKGYNAVD